MTQAKTLNSAADDEPIVLGERTRLYDGTPVGLFESDKGNRYLITHNPNHNFEAKVTVALVHKKLRPFTWQALCGIYMEHGRWLGPYRLRFVHSVQGQERNSVGTLNIGECFVGQVTLRCRSVTGSKIWMSLGHADDKRDTRFYDGWIVEAVEGDRLFFEQSHNREGSMVHEIRAEPYPSTAA